ncbi:hypothetical protein VTK26DRAFT_7404 [Humicola hyalothermophila]
MTLSATASHRHSNSQNSWDRFTDSQTQREPLCGVPIRQNAAGKTSGKAERTQRLMIDLDRASAGNGRFGSSSGVVKRAAAAAAQLVEKKNPTPTCHQHAALSKGPPPSTESLGAAGNRSGVPLIFGLRAATQNEPSSDLLRSPPSVTWAEG